MKKLLIAVDTYFPKKDGVVRFLENIVPRLEKYYFITIVAPDFNGREKFFDRKNVNEIVFPVEKKKSFAGYNPVKKTKNIRKIIKREVRNCDIVFSQDIAYIGRLAIKYGKELRKPVVSYVHQISWEQVRGIFAKKPLQGWFASSFVKFVAKRIYRKCSLLFVPSKTTAEQLKKEGVRKEKIIISLGIDLEKFSPPESKPAAKIGIKIDPRKSIIGYCGRISKEKDLLTLKDVFLAIKEKFPDSVLLIVGGGAGEDAEILKKTEDVIVTGFVKDVTPYLKAMDIFVLPSLTETTSLATMEAMACGVPVITTPVGRLAEYVHNNVNGYLFPPGRKDILAKRISELLSNSEKRNFMGRNARKSISQFSWDITVQKMVGVFENLTR